MAQKDFNKVNVSVTEVDTPEIFGFPAQYFRICLGDPNYSLDTSLGERVAYLTPSVKFVPPQLWQGIGIFACQALNTTLREYGVGVIFLRIAQLESELEQTVQGSLFFARQEYQIFTVSNLLVAVFDPKISKIK